MNVAARQDTRVLEHDKDAERVAAERTCVVCRAAKEPLELLSLQLVGDEVTVGSTRRGRGAWVCTQAGCLTQLSGPVASRAFRHAVRVPAEFLASVHALAERRVLEMLGLARRQNAVTLGSDRVSGGGAKLPALAKEQGIVVVANDVAARTQAGAGDASWTFVGAEALGHALGAGRVGVLRVAAGTLAAQAAYWLTVWYESRGPSA